MARILKTPLPTTSTLWSYVRPGDFVDGYAVASDLSPHEALTVGMAMPGWADALLRLRNLLVRPFGLKTDVSDSADGIFPVHHDNPAEMIVGTDDVHLNFRIAVRREGPMIHMGTWVHRNNLLGRLYLMAVMPFHILIVRAALRRIAAHSPAP